MPQVLPGQTIPGHTAPAQPRQVLPAWAKPVGVGALGLGGLIWIATVDPNEPGHYPTCPSLWLAGIYCPGCGSLRGIHALTHLDFAALVGMNPALLLALPYLGWAWVFWLLRSVGLAQRKRLAPAWVLWTLFGALLAYWVLRNIPALAPWLAPGGVVAPAFS
ncbi:MAG: DUF2752 domain-containing protein [Propionibacteriaceae bacterium]|jgi:hypothetical protein|nr:DUF2752 domain-containing protein [Propionibacteriaceae bacterium]